MDAFIAGAWRTARRGEVFASGQWRRLTRAEAYLGGQWRQVVTFVPPLSLSVTPLVEGYRSSQKPSAGVVTTNFAIATPNGGTGPYRYQWSASGVTFSSPTNASTNLSATLAAESEFSGPGRVTCADSLGTVATADFMFYFQNQSNL